MQAYKIIDNTRLGEVSAQDVEQLCQQSNQHENQVAAICLPSKFITQAKSLLDAKIKIATVANFPKGNAPLEDTLAEIENALAQGADEIDVVLPYRNLAAGPNYIKACKQACGDKTLKVIIESGELKRPELIKQATLLCCEARADFVKTSTGFTEIGATIEAATAILDGIQEYYDHTAKLVGIKLSGGIRDWDTANQYIDLAAQYFGEAYISPVTFRIGASKLVS